MTSEYQEEYTQDYFPVVALSNDTHRRIYLRHRLEALTTSRKSSGEPPKEAALVEKGEPYFFLVTHVDSGKQSPFWIACAREATMGPEFAGNRQHYPIRRSHVILAREDYIKPEQMHGMSEREKTKFVLDIINNENLKTSAWKTLSL